MRLEEYSEYIEGRINKIEDRLSKLEDAQRDHKGLIEGIVEILGGTRDCLQGFLDNTFITDF